MGIWRRLRADLFDGWLGLRRRFSPALLDELTTCIANGERSHQGELRLVIESRLSPLAVLQGLTPRQRAIELFSRLRVWDTEHNSGVLVYLLLAEHAIEIVADRGIAARVAPEEWQAICAQMQQAYAQGRWREGSLAGVEAIHRLLQCHFPPQDEAGMRDELPNRPLVL